MSSDDAKSKHYAATDSIPSHPVTTVLSTSHTNIKQVHMFSLLWYHSQKYFFSYLPSQLCLSFRPHPRIFDPLVPLLLVPSLQPISPSTAHMASSPTSAKQSQKWSVVNLSGFDPEPSCVTKCVCEGGNPNLAVVKGRINKIKRCGARTFISDGLGRDRIGPACCFPPSAGVMFAGSMCCKVGVVLAQGATPAPVLRVNPILPGAWWATEWRRARQRSESVDNAEAGNLTQLRHWILSLPLHVPLHKHQPPP